MEAKILKYDTDKSDKEEQEIKAIRNKRNLWIKNLKQEDKHETLFELEMFLKAVERYGIFRNHPIPESESLISRNFKEELSILHETIGKIIILTQRMLPSSVTSAKYFEDYVTSELLPDHARSNIYIRGKKQSDPVDSLAVLRTNLVDIQEVISNLLNLKVVSYKLFTRLMRIINREIASNVFFNPIRVSEFSPQSDTITNPKILAALRSVTDHYARKEISIALIVLFRIIRYVDRVVEDTADKKSLKADLIIFTLVNSELSMLVDRLENEFIHRKKNGVKNGNGEGEEMDKRSENIIATMDAVAYQLAMELKKVMGHEISNAAAITDVAKLRQGIARSKGVVSGILKHSVVQIIASIDDRIKGRDIFEDFISRMEISIKLRKDLWIFLKVLENLENTISQAEPTGKMRPVMEATKSLRNYMYYFQNTSFQLVRYIDQDAFLNFFTYVDEFNIDDINHRVKFEDFKRTLHYFKMFLETTLSNVEHRSELKGKPFGSSERDQVLEKFLK